jgi:hypothetical protein
MKLQLTKQAAAELALAQRDGQVGAPNGNVQEEIRHDKMEVAMGHSSTLSHSSSGEQRKALLLHLIKKNPGYLIIDGLFEE